MRHQYIAAELNRLADAQALLKEASFGNEIKLMGASLNSKLIFRQGEIRRYHVTLLSGAWPSDEVLLAYYTKNTQAEGQVLTLKNLPGKEVSIYL